jgi:hypothetical protein
MRTRIALLLDGGVALGLVLRAVAPAEETRIAQAAGPPSAELAARGRELFTTEKMSGDDLRDLVEFLTTL